ncbi:MAG TPA: phosphatidylinositol mannoside acyltransferase, partial [Iamia sp.]|nr:phosphatidylinositol mannoside acyltransferase [Iamia sp.]
MGYRAGALAARALPGRTVPAVADLIGKVGARRLASRRLIVERNLRRALGEEVSEARLAELVDASFASYVQYWIESFRLPGTAAADIDRGTVVIGYEHVAAARAAGTGAIMCLPHLGAWEWAAFWLKVVHGDPVTAVAEQIEPPELADWFIGLRNRFGIEVVPFGPDAASACVRALKDNRLLALPSDRDLSGTGVPVTFFGEETTLPGGPATLALRTGAPLIPVSCYFDNDRHLGIALPPLDTQRRGKLREDVARI